MPKNVLIVTASLRAGSNSDTLAQAFAKGAREAGHTVEIVSLKGKAISFCQGCLACQKAQKCVLADDAVIIAEKIGHADVVAFAGPVYYYGLAGQLKTLLDRCNPLYSSDYAFRSVYLLATAAEAEETAVEGSIKGIQGWVDCFEKAELSDTIFAGGVTDAGEMEGHPALEKAYQAGKSIR
ncbi:flavodoxin family protein [Subdoligranulum variabile]|uniref:flavodoxin family protein n=1 Tax=Subdoligranulum variabile TaxID=214851 RepID=UPI0029434B3C|nr:flavodoxin family protein [Subdoligranulum variabile]